VQIDLSPQTTLRTAKPRCTRNPDIYLYNYPPKTDFVKNLGQITEKCVFATGNEFFREKYPNEKKFYDMIPTLLEKKYLKTIFNCHQCAETLDKSDLNNDGEINVLDIDFILHGIT
jgi:hypothetical protein